jgi:hypothetical protein
MGRIRCIGFALEIIGFFRNNPPQIVILDIGCRKDIYKGKD